MESASLGFWDGHNVIWIGVGALSGWILSIERRLGRFLTRQEHAKLGSERDAAMTKTLDEIKTSVFHSAEQRDKLMDHVGQMRVDIATLMERSTKG